MDNKKKRVLKNVIFLVSLFACILYFLHGVYAPDVQLGGVMGTGILDSGTGYVSSGIGVIPPVSSYSELPSGSGIVRDKKTGLLKVGGEGDKVSGAEIYKIDPTFLLGRPNYLGATKEQRIDFNKIKINIEFEVKDIIGNSNNLQWEGADIFSYGGTRIDKKKLEGVAKIEFSPDGKIFVYGDNGGKTLINNDFFHGGNAGTYSRLGIPEQSSLNLGADLGIGGENIPESEEYQVPPETGSDDGEIPSAGSGFGSGAGSRLPPGLGGMNDFLQSVLPILEKLIGLMNPIIEAVKTNGQGEAKVEQGPNQLIIFQKNGPEEKDVPEAEIDYRDGNKILVTPNDKTQESVSTVDKSGQIKSKNGMVVVPEVGVVFTPPVETEINFGQAKTQNPVPASNEREEGTSIGITGAVITSSGSGQQISFIEQDIEVAGKDISFYMFKSFDEVSAFGKNLMIINGKTLIVFDGKNIYYPREIKKTPHFINKFSNDNDNENYFQLLQGGSIENYLADGKRIATVGDKVVNHPTMQGLVIAKQREEIWKRYE